MWKNKEIKKGFGAHSHLGIQSSKEVCKGNLSVYEWQQMFHVRYWKIKLKA